MHMHRELNHVVLCCTARCYAAMRHRCPLLPPPSPPTQQAETPSRKELELFLKEVQTLAKLHHRNIVQFYGACLEMGSMFFVTELMKVREGRRQAAQQG